MKWLFFRDLITLSLFLVLLSVFQSCGDTLEISKSQFIVDDLDAMYYFPLGGMIEVNQDQYSRVTITMVDYLTSINPESGDLGEHPKTTITDKFLSNNGLLFYSVNVNYSSGDLEHDVTGSNITGIRRTDFIFQWQENKLIVNIQIYESPKNNNVNSVIANRTLIGEK